MTTRVYSMSAWHRDFAKAFAAGVPLEAAGPQARGPLLAAENDEQEPDLPLETPTEYAQRRSREHDEGAMELQQRMPGTELERALGWRGR